MDKHKTMEITFFLLRVAAGFMFFSHGAQKFLGWFGGFHGEPGATAPLMTQIGIGGLLEFFGGLAMVIGIGTRYVAFILSGMMAVAYWQFHAPNGALPIVNHGELAVLYCFLFLFISMHGGGRWSLDALFQAKRGNAQLP